MWLGSLTNSIAKGKPDIEYVDLTSRIATVQEILDVTNKPLILDGDSGGLVEHFVLAVRTLERIGVSAIIIEDRMNPKRGGRITPRYTLFKISIGITVALIRQTGHKSQSQSGGTWLAAGCAKFSLDNPFSISLWCLVLPQSGIGTSARRRTNWKMVHHLTCAMTLPQAKPAALTASCFQSQDFADKNLHKSLKNNDLPPPSIFGR